MEISCNNRFLNYYLFCLLLSVVGCKKDNYINVLPVDFHNLHLWENDDHELALEVFIRNCKKIDRGNWDHLSNVLKYDIKERMQHVCVMAPLYKDNSKFFFENYFTPYLVFHDATPYGLVTGYYEITIEGSYTKDDVFKYPIYKTPSSISEQTLSRAEIESGKLDGKNLELLYTNDKVKLFFLHIQGSGIAKFKDNSEIKIGYSSKNGHKYVPIGKYLRDTSKLDSHKINAESIINWLHQNPEDADMVMNQNPSYVYFQKNDLSAPIGKQGVELTAERSIATDNQFIPLGALVWLETTYPNYSKFHKLTLAQDTGGAIKGPNRFDIFFGRSNEAELNAFHMKHRGKSFILIPNPY